MELMLRVRLLTFYGPSPYFGIFGMFAATDHRSRAYICTYIRPIYIVFVSRAPLVELAVELLANVIACNVPEAYVSLIVSARHRHSLLLVESACCDVIV